MDFIVIDGFNNFEINTNGEVRNIKTGKAVKIFTDKFGYCSCHLKDDKKTYTKKIHRLVAQTFIPNIYNSPSVDHINRIRNDNNVSNLRWATSKENNENKLCKETGMYYCDIKEKWIVINKNIMTYEFNNINEAFNKLKDFVM